MQLPLHTYSRIIHCPMNGLVLLLCIMASSCSRHETYKAPENPLFTLLSPEETGLAFRNDVKDDSSFNEFSYRNFYNGGGVAIGDINNDGLPDVFMTANQGSNRLFLNKGNFKFEDITAAAGIKKDQGWSTGVTMVDINGDGLLDIYICAAGSIKGDPRNNELYINKGNLHFTEEAAKYHLQDSGAMHTQAVFFDYDGDGDLDVFLLNNNAQMPVNNYGIGSIRTISDPVGGDKLLRNDHGIFTDVTRAAGIYGSGISFGLGVVVGDVNGDQWPDLYISNDFFEKDYLYINQRDGTFREKSDSSLGHMSQTSMGVDMADLNNDGQIDIISTDMLPEDDYRLKKNTRFDTYDVYNSKYKAGYHHQLTSNMLHLNNGDNTFSEIAEFAGVDATDWSWGALIFDCDNDGWKDLTICNGMYLDVTDQDYIDFLAADNERTFARKPTGGMNYTQLQAVGPSNPSASYEFINNHDLTFSDRSYASGLSQPAYSNGAAYADLDRDGDEDLIINTLNGESRLYRNNSTERVHKNYLRVRMEGEGMNRFGIGTKVTIYAGGQTQVMENFPTRGFQSSVEPLLTFGLDTLRTIDSLLVIWPDRKTQVLRQLIINKELVLRQKEAASSASQPPARASLFREMTAQSIRGNILHKENDYNDFNRERLLPRLLSTEGPRMSIGDINGDGRPDFFIGNAKHDTGKIFLQTPDGTFVPLLPQKDLAADNNFETIGSAFFDADKDGDLDLILVSGGNLEKVGSEWLTPRLYLNDGKGHFTRAKEKLPFISVNASCVLTEDIDGDGWPDLFIGGRSVPGEYGASPRSYLLHNNRGVFEDCTAANAPQLMNIGMVTDAIWQDLDKDGKKELVVVGEWMPVTIFSNENGHLTLSPLNRQLTYSSGWWNCIKAADLDNDGNIDLVLGNLGSNSKIRADSLHPSSLYCSDFDGNGIRESILTYYKKDGKSYPLPMKSEITAQLPFLKKELLHYKDYAGRSMKELFTASQLNNASVKNAYELRSCILHNKGNGIFKLEPLPARAQLSPVYTILIDDLDGDGLQDLFLAGNLFGLQPQLGRYDANYGTFLQGQKDHSFQYLPAAETGLFYYGAARDVKLIETKDGKKTILLARNNDKLQIYKSNKPTWKQHR